MKERTSNNVCPLCDIMATVTKRWFLLVLDNIGQYESMHYNELLNKLRPISPKALADVLKELQDVGLIYKKTRSGQRQTTEYSLNKHGKELKNAIMPMLKWCAEYTGHTNCPILAAPKR